MYLLCYIQCTREHVNSYAISVLVNSSVFCVPLKFESVERTGVITVTRSAIRVEYYKLLMSLFLFG